MHHARSFRAAHALACFAVLAAATAAHAEDGGNDACPAVAVAADDVRDDYDDRGRLVHELRLKGGVLVEEIALQYRGDHAVTRSEQSPGHLRVAKNYWHADDLLAGECYEDGARVGYVAFERKDGKLVGVDKRRLAAPTTVSAGVAPHWQRETSSLSYDADGQLVETVVRDGDGRVLGVTRAERSAARVPIVLAFLAGGSYQSDTLLYDATAGIGIHRRPKVQRYGSDPLEVGLDGTYKFHRASRVTSTDQTTLRFGADYHDILPRITLFTFTATDRNVPANLRLNLEEAVLGAKLDIVRPGPLQLDVSFAPVWNFRSILTPTPTATLEQTTSKLRGSFRARAGLHRPTWSCVDTFEFLPTLFGDDVAQEDDFWHRTVMRNTVTLDVKLGDKLTFREEFKYTWDTAMRAQADCPDASNPLCLGYAFASTTALELHLEL